MRKSLSLILLALLLCGLMASPSPMRAAQAETQTVHVTNASKDFSLVGVAFPDMPKVTIPEIKDAIEPQKSADVVMANGSSRLLVDMGMVRFVFPAANYAASKKLTVGLSQNEVPMLKMDAEQNNTPIYGVLLNLRAADAGDEAIFDYSQFFYPADATDACEVLGIEVTDIATGYEGKMDFGGMPAKGKVIADDKGALTLELRLPLTPKVLQKIPAALNSAGLCLKSTTITGTKADKQWQSTGIVKADEHFLSGLGTLLGPDGGKGTATLVVEYMGDPKDSKARRGVLEMDFAAKTLVAKFQ